jgi:hypothetical protein
MVKRAVLKYSENEMGSNVILFAISSSQSDIHICQLINQSLGIRLALSEPAEILNKGISLQFIRYTFNSDQEIEKFHLIVNRNGGNYLFPELKKIDFFLVISTESPVEQIDSAIRVLKLNKGISAICKLDPALLKSFSKLQL